MVIRGAVYRIDLGRPRGRERGGRRHGVVLDPVELAELEHVLGRFLGV